MTTELNIRKWDPSSLEKKRLNGHPPKILIVGKTGTGKTTLVQDLLFYIRKIHSGVVICPTEQSLVDYRLMFPETLIHEAWDKELIAEFLRMQKKIRKTDSSFHQLLMLDDIMYDKNAILKDESTRFIFMNGRNNNITMIITMQYCMDLTPDLRNNIDFIIALRDNIHSNREKLWRNFFGVIPNSDMFHQVFQSCTTGYNCIVLDNTSRSANISDCIFYYSADATPEPARITRVVGLQNDAYDIQFEDSQRSECVNKSWITTPQNPRRPFQVGDTIDVKFKRTWLTLPAHKRRCFHRDLWNFHSARFNPNYDEDRVNSTTSESSGAGNSSQQNNFQQQFKSSRKNKNNMKVKMI